MRPEHLRGVRKIEIKKECRTLLITLDKFNSLLYLDDNNFPCGHQINHTNIVFFATVKVGCSLEYLV